MSSCMLTSSSMVEKSMLALNLYLQLDGVDEFHLYVMCPGFRTAA